jgi:ubiquinone/menaquinone biosynthesis C-methylase UbiE
MSDYNQVSSAGHVLSAPDWLDVHLSAALPAYEAMLDVAGFRDGDFVLDAGCGSGSYLPLIQSRIGLNGRLVAMDFADENVDLLPQRFPEARALLGSVLSLPFATASFDGAWCANVLQYFDDADLLVALREMARVVKPGGVVAVKDVDMTAWRISPAPPLLGAHLAEVCIRGADATVQSFGSLRGRELGLWLERAGLSDARQTAVPIEYRAPLSQAAASLWADWLPYLARLAVDKGVPDEDLEVWRRLLTREGAAAFVSQPDFYACELQVVAVGRVG